MWVRTATASLKGLLLTATHFDQLTKPKFCEQTLALQRFYSLCILLLCVEGFADLVGSFSGFRIDFSHNSGTCGK